MARIKHLLIVLFIWMNMVAWAQSETHSVNSVFIQAEPEYLSLNYDRGLSEDGDKWHLRAGFMFNFSLWMGVPLQLSYLIPIGNETTHLSLGAVAAYTWNSQSSPWEIWAGLATGFRFQKNPKGLFVRSQIVTSYNKYWSGTEFHEKFRLRPNIGLGYSF